MKQDDIQLLRTLQARDGARASSPRGEPAPGGAVERVLARWLLRPLARLPLRLTLWNGLSTAPKSGAAAANVRVNNWRALLGLVLDPDMSFGDSHTDGSIEVDGDLLRLLEAAYYGRGRNTASGRWQRACRWLYRPRRNSLAGSRDNIHQHYDIGNDFYRLWLDRRMVYTCAYFSDAEMSLEQAQVAKMDHVCRKLRLRPGDRVVEAGCGWGTLALHMASCYGAHVRAFNISHEQIAYARENARSLGLDSQVEFVEDDYRNISSRCDAFVSVGMIEHIGRDHYHDLGRVIERCLDNEGRGLLHSIGQNQPGPLNPWIERRIFPGAYPPTLAEMMTILEPWRFSVLDVENLRQHYALTLTHRLRRFEGARAKVLQMFGENFVRAWRLYFAGSQAAFSVGALQLFQVLFTRESNNSMPWTRDYIYRG